MCHRVRQPWPERKAGADAVKVGIGPGSICTTRIIAGVGVPQLSAIMDVASRHLKAKCSAYCRRWYPLYRRYCKPALAAGAGTVMMGGMFGTEESPAKRSFSKVENLNPTGHGFIEAMQKGSKDRYFQDAEDDIKTGSRRYQRKGSV